ncbi:tetratricopeptide repeat protein [Novipirellula artificiosorum]|uniref:Tetratricopeptide repeat protein n=1 Tax=Novipirellula artificiosorum TaxID=2528016 RepID=A0A5C6DGU3_9BACT|nr:tetratricopeptide repeat protein [Novipirellula artificiosorum]TWU34209.1 tetratricopeptide repeat protein [Novipirellula artificiosorum]
MSPKRSKQRKTQKQRKSSREESSRSSVPIIWLVAIGLLLAGVGGVSAWWFASSPTIDATLQPTATSTTLGKAQPPALKIQCPFDGSLFPAEIAPTRFVWRDKTDQVDRWKILIEFADGAPMQFTANTCEWTPPEDAWNEIKQRSLDAKAHVAVYGIDSKDPENTLSEDHVSISTSRDEVGAPIFYREVNLPFAEAVKDPGAHIRWRFGSIANCEQPPVVLDKMPLCGNCHSFSSDGKTLGMDVDYGSDKGSYVLSPVSQEMTFDDPKIITWSDYKPEADEETLGLLSQVSPDGRYVISTVKDASVFAPLDDLEFSQLFFPVRGILAFYDLQNKTFHALPGADDPNFVQSNPAWSPDGKHIVFARHESCELKVTKKGHGLIKREDVRDFIDHKEEFQFDLWRIPFNDGKGGTPKPLLGASNNEMSNYFPKYSPDGKWIVFCQAKSFMLLQPDSELFLIPAEGGEARRLNCNTNRMNSWHSWSPNGKWMVFSSKTLSPYTQLFLTHFDEAGRTTPPVVLSHFTSDQMAANIPEFVNTSDDAIAQISQNFIDEYALVKEGKSCIFDGEYELAIQAFERALAENPEYAEARLCLGDVYLRLNKIQQAKDQIAIILDANPDNGRAHVLHGSILERTGEFSKAAEAYRSAIKAVPDSAPAYHALGVLSVQMGKTNEGKEHLIQASRLDPEFASPYVALARVLLLEQKVDQAETLYRKALRRDPESSAALAGLAVTLLNPLDITPEDAKQALRLSTQAYKFTGGKDPSTLLVHAQALAENGLVHEAFEISKTALMISQQTGDRQNASSARLLLNELQRL